MYYELIEEQNLRKVAELLCIYLTIPEEVQKCAKSAINSSDKYRYNIEILNLFNPELQLVNTKSKIKNKLKELLSELKKFKAQTILVWEYKETNGHQLVFHSSTKLIASDSDIDEVFRSMYQSIMTKIKKLYYEN